MNDFFTRQALNYLTGLTVYDSVAGTDVALVNNTWVDLYSEADTTELVFLSGYNVTRNLNGGSVTQLELRILAAPSSVAIGTLGNTHKVFPFTATTSVYSGSDYNIKDLLRIPAAHHFKIQARATITGAPTSKLEYLSLIRVSTLNHT